MLAREAQLPILAERSVALPVTIAVPLVPSGGFSMHVIEARTERTTKKVEAQALPSFPPVASASSPYFVRAGIIGSRINKYGPNIRRGCRTI